MAIPTQKEGYGTAAAEDAPGPRRSLACAVWLGQARAKVPVAVLELVQCPVFISLDEQCGLREMPTWCGFPYSLRFSLLSSLCSAGDPP